MHDLGRRVGLARKVLTAAVLVILLAPLGWHAPAATASSSDPVFDEWELFRAINARRASSGLPPLRMQPALRGIARNWAASMASRNQVGQNPNLFNEINASVTPPRYAAAENVAKDFSVAGVDESFSQPPLQSAVLGQYSYVGIGVVWSGTTLFVTADFLQPTQVLATVAPPVAWYVRNINSSGVPNRSFDYGDPGDRALVCDWNGDGTATPGIFRNGTWYLRNFNTTGIGDVTVGYGDAGDVPLGGDWDGDGTDTVGVFRNGNVYLRNTNTSGIGEVNFAYGDVGDVPLGGDWDGDGTDTVGVARGS